METETTVIDTPENTLGEFARLASMLAEAGDNKRRRDEAVDGIEIALGKLSGRDMPELLENATIQKLLEMVGERRVEKGGSQPGEVVGEGLATSKVPWRKQDLTEANGFKYIDWLAPESTTIIWNGIDQPIFEGVVMRLPEVFVDVYMTSRQALRARQQHQDYLFAPVNARGAIAGVPADPSLLEGKAGSKSRMIRGAFAGGLFNPGAGTALMVPDADRPGIEDSGEGGEDEG